MKESQCLLHLQRLFWTPFCSYFSARRPREILAAARARASRDDTICSKNRNFDPYHRDKARSRAYGLLPLWLLVECFIEINLVSHNLVQNMPHESTNCGPSNPKDHIECKQSKHRNTIFMLVIFFSR